jgi:Outer membrane protein beta-barrel domain
MKKIMAVAALAGMVTAAGNAAAEDFSGAYVGGDVGVNRSSTSGSNTTSSSNSASYGLSGGYGWNLGSTFLGVEGYVDSNQQATHSPAAQYGSNAYGLGLKIGVPIDSLMPYARLSYDRTSGTGDLSGFNTNGTSTGLGLMYKFAPSWSVEGEVSTVSPSMNGLKLKADSFSFGLNYHFDVPSNSVGGKGKSR